MLYNGRYEEVKPLYTNTYSEEDLVQKSTLLGASWEQYTVMSQNFRKEQIARALELDFPLFQLIYDFNIPKDILSVLYSLVEMDSYHRIRMFDYMAALKVKDLYEGFKARFNRLPQVFVYIIEIIHELNVKLVVEKFDVESMKYALSLSNEIPSIHHRITYGILFHKRIYEVVSRLKKNNRNLLSFVAGLPCKYPLLNQELENWVATYAGKTKNEIIHEVMAYWDEPDFPRESSLEVKRAYFRLNRLEMEWERCCRKYPEVFRQPFQTHLDLVKVEMKDRTAYILDPNDKKQVLLGHLSVCCQRLGGSAEASMMEGLLNPDSGFLVFEQEYKLLGQSWVWLSENKNVLVLDNIEFADNRKPIHILDLLKEWLRQVKYVDIQMGIGFNQLSIGQPVKEYELYWYDQVWNQRYTDANQRVWLKKNNRILI